MLLVLSDEHKEHLAFLSNVATDVVREFCRISVEFIKKGSNPRVYQSAAQKLGVEATTVQHGVEGLMYLLTECSKMLISEIDFKDSVMVLGYSEELNDQLYQLYQENYREIRSILSSMAMDLPHYHNLEWRFEVQLASRSLQRQTQPKVLLRIHTKEDDKLTTHLIQADPANLVHLTQVLESALAEVKTQHCRRIMRNIK
ncbi:COMM domain-containing protein 2-like [Halichondria panicea]|uniref:COMM domain-containing protein 2-like n=1 Tax=Halichondria panicea TaxID=6063 RepID=UPI00312BAE0C